MNAFTACDNPAGASAAAVTVAGRGAGAASLLRNLIETGVTTPPDGAVLTMISMFAATPSGRTLTTRLSSTRSWPEPSATNVPVSGETVSPTAPSRGWSIVNNWASCCAMAAALPVPG